jgi:outer membrane protein assembly factor BamB
VVAQILDISLRVTPGSHKLGAVRRNWHLFVLGPLVAGSGCKEPEPAPPPEASSPTEIAQPDRRAQCEQLARDAATGASIGIKLWLLALADGSPDSSVRSDVVAQCLTWSEETLECLSSPLAALGDDCQDRIAELTGQAVAPRDIPMGPGVAWRTTLPNKALDLRIAADGKVVVLFEQPTADGPGLELLALATGDVVWRKRLEAGTRLVSESLDPLVRWRTNEIGALDLVSGSVRWTTWLPDDPDELGPPSIRAVAIAPSGWVIADSEARFFGLSSSACASKGSSCWNALGRLSDETLDGVELRVQGDSVWIHELDALRAFALGDLTPRFSARAHDSVGWVVDHPQGIATLIDDHVMVLDTMGCASAGPVIPWSWPQPGLDECTGCEQPPPGCVKWRIHVRDVDATARPAVLDDGTIVVHDDRGFTRGLRDGEIAWSTATRGIGPTLCHADELLVLSTGFSEGDRLAIRGLSGVDGRHRFETPLPFSVDELVVSTDDFLFASAGNLVAVAHRTQLAIVDMTRDD